MRFLRKLFASVALCAFVGMAVPAAVAVQPDEVLQDPELEKRARVLSAELRCLVCQNQSIDDSDAPLAADLRRLVRERLKANDTDEQALDYIVARYGEFVLLRPRLTASTILLWTAPVLVFLAGALLAFRAVRSRQWGGIEAAGLSAAEREKLARILNEEPGAGQHKSPDITNS